MLVIISGNNCFNMSDARRQLLLSGRSPAEEAIFRDHIFRVYYGWLALPVSVIALFFNFVFITATLRAIRGHRVSRKFYVLMLNRAFGDVLTCLVALTTFVYVILVPRVSQNVIQLMNTFFAGSFWSAMVTYVAAGVLKLYGVAKPLHYHNGVTMRTCIHIIWFSWSVFLLLTILTMCATAFVKIAPLAAWSGCNMEKCLTPVYRFRNALTALVYLLTITCFVLTVILIRRASHKAKILRNGLSDAHNSKSQISFVSLDDNRQDPPREQRLNKRHPQNNHFALIKLTLGVSSLALFHLPYTIWAIILSFAPACYLTFHWTTMQSLMGLVRASLILRIIVDVPISFILDIQEKKTMAARKNPNNGFFAGAPPSVNFFTSIDDEISDPIAPDQDAADQELLARETENKLRLNKKKDLKQDRPEYNEEQNATLGSADSEIFDSGPFQSASIGGTSGHVVSSPFEISHYPIEIQENRKAMQRQISSRKPRMESSRGDQLNQFTSGANTPSTERNSQCVSPMSPSRSMTSGALQVDSGPKLMDALDAMKEQKESQRIEMHTFRDAIDVNYQRMALTEEELSGVPLEDLKAASKFLIEGVRLRQEYMEMIGCHFPSTTKHFLHGHYPDNLPKCRKKNTEVSAHTSFHPPEPPSDHWGTSQPLPIYEKKYKLKRHRGTVAILDDRGEIVPELKKYYITKEKYLKDYERLIIMTANGPLKSFSYRRLAFLQTKFQLHVLLNDIRELHEQKSVPHRDFYNIRKVDTHIHAASSMNQKHLLRFIKKKMKTEADVVVHEQNGKKITMRQLFESLGLGAYDLSVDMLDVHADRNTFHRFDKFNTKYNPVGQSVLRDVFIKTDNYVGGKYFAEVLKEVFSDLEDSKYQQAEPRISIYGRKKDEWDKLAKWAITHDVWSTNIRWIIQVPRLFDVYKSKSMIANFDDFLDNLFTPLFEVTNDPSSHPELHCFLQYVTAMDSVDDESKHEYVHFDLSTPEPINYSTEENPPYSYYLYYMYANLAALNAFRRMRGLNTIALKTHCGEAGHINHLMVGYLTSESIAHGLLLRKVPVLQYLFYLCQIGIAMSPLSNNSLFISYPRNPLPEYLMKGLNVSLSTDDPLQFHFTKEALMEEFSIAAQVWKLSGADMCELARNSVLQSGFEDKVKIHWLGPNYKEEGVLGNDVARTNVPDIRVSFRHEALVDELNNLFRASHF